MICEDVHSRRIIETLIPEYKSVDMAAFKITLICSALILIGSALGEDIPMGQVNNFRQQND